MGLRIAKIHEDPIAHVLRYEPAEALDSLGHALLIGGNHFAEVFGVHAGRKRGRAHQVAEHHCDLAALGAVALLWDNGSRGRSGMRRSAFLDAIQLGYGAQQQASMTERRDPEFLQVCVCEIRQDGKGNLVLNEALSVLPETELLQPLGDRLRRQCTHAANSSSNAFASFRSRVSNPSVNHP
jgi:hypothetical protein